MKLKYTLISVLVGSSIIPLVLGFFYLTSFISEQQRSQVQDSLEAITQIAKIRILSSVDRIIDNTALVASRTQLRKSVLAVQDDASNKHLVTINKIINDAAVSIKNMKEITIFSPQGTVIASTLKQADVPSSDLPSQFPFVSLTEQTNTTRLNGYDQLILDGEPIGIIKLSVEPNFIAEIVQQGKALGDTGEWIVAIKNDNGDAVLVSKTRYENEGAFNRTVLKEATNVPIARALTGYEGIIWDGEDYAGFPVVAATAFIPRYDWGIVAKISKEELSQQLNNVKTLFFVALIILFALSLAIGITFSYLIARPIEALAKQASELKHNHKKNLDVDTQWSEVKVLTQQFNKLLFDINQLNEDLNEKVAVRTEELAKAYDNIVEQKAKAEAATQAKSSFLANMSHELRTPLNSIHGSLQLLARQALDEKSTQLINTATYSMKSLLGIINDVLDFSKIEAQAIDLETGYFNCEEVARQVLTEMEMFASKKGLLLRYEREQDYHEGWLGDELRVKQILLNFVSNAIKFTQTGEVVIRIGLKQSNGTKQLMYKITDTGCGMSQTFIKKLFERFSQADSTTTRKFGGTGLGMPISLGLVKLMNGTIDVASVEDKGTTITTLLPLSTSSHSEHEEISYSHISAPNLSNKTILLAEDNEINQVIFCSMLEETKANVVVASNGEEAVAANIKHSPDIVFLDIHMPVMDGVEACKKIKHDTPNTPLVSITANVSKEDIQAYTRHGFDYHVGKPVDLVTLYKILRSLVTY